MSAATRCDDRAAPGSPATSVPPAVGCGRHRSRRRLVPRTAAEEVFYPEAEEVGGEAEELVKEGVEEHHVVEVLMGEMRGCHRTTTRGRRR
ncbi:MAG: hypothetical protein M3O86_06410 [Actinomycetota bacterium]|nr:hypothetical protein [Actinomycetota bacterium]